MDKDKDKESEIKESAEFYKRNNIKVHIVLLTKDFNGTPTRRFYNGVIKEVLSTNIVIEDVKIGIMTIPMREIFILETYNDNNTPKNGTT